ncbi:ABC transporter permease [Rhizobium lusitanum]|uniref:NitT/TauT family transport system permease protein n=1 Tax=Rhizobium lusitanum TaxID=293958 RepID=A0A7X0IZ85_9HYPH|nr:ABC transporter permease [Rhizobium lusitanum]MBB6488657.1 NitT/TauT family transport system permease protein [Rhizobium lusitanum]
MTVDSIKEQIGVMSGPHDGRSVRNSRARGLFAIRNPLSRPVSLALSVAFFLVLLAVWAFVSATGLVSDFFLPGPVQVIGAAWSLYIDKGFLGDIAVSIYRVLVGFGLAAIVAVPLGLMMGSVQFFRSLLEPCLAFTRYMPATAFIPLLVLWLGIDDGQKFSVIFVGTFFTLTLMVMVSTLAVSVALIEAAIMLGATPMQIIFKVILPAAKPAIFNDLRIVLGWAWTYIVIAEIVAASSGVGYIILSASRFMDTATIFVGIISIGLIGLISDMIFNVAGRYFFPYLQRGRS